MIPCQTNQTEALQSYGLMYAVSTVWVIIPHTDDDFNVMKLICDKEPQSILPLNLTKQWELSHFTIMWGNKSNPAPVQMFLMIGWPICGLRNDHFW